MTDSPLIVGVVGNDIVYDTRIKKVAASAAAAGFRSTILCYTPKGTLRNNRMGDVDVIRVPVPFNAHHKNSRIPAPLHPFNGSELGIRHAGPRTHLLARRRWLEADLADTSRGGPARIATQVQLLWTRVSLKLRHEGFRVRRKAHTESERLVRWFNRSRTRATRRTFRGWRDPIPNIADYEMSFGPILEELKPDIIHAHDYHMIGIAVTAATKLRLSGHGTKVVYDAHEWIPGLSYSQSILDGWLQLQDRFIRRVDAVSGVSPEQIDQLVERYELTVRPTLVLNAPLLADEHGAGSDVRSDLGIDGKIVTYHGNIFLERGLDTVIESLRYLDQDVHVAILAPKDQAMIGKVRDLAQKTRVEDRVHLLKYVPAHRLSHYLSTADVSVVPYLVTGNNDIALPNKLFESIQAGVPVVVSNMRSLSRIVEEKGIGLVFEAGSHTDLAAKIKAITDDPGSFRKRITTELKSEFSWDSQAKRIVQVYCELTGREAPELPRLTTHKITEALGDSATSVRPTRLAVGPRNMAGQAFQIANAVQKNIGIPTLSFSIEKPEFEFPIHIQIEALEWRDPEWQERQLDFLSRGFTHILAESGTGPLGTRGGGFIDEQLKALEERGLSVAVVLHGSEIRDPRRHRSLAHSPYQVDDELTQSLEKATKRLREHLSRVDLPLFVTTPDLLADVDATWLPTVIEPALWENLGEPFTNRVPRVLHMPTNSRLKGSAYIDPVLNKLADEGLIEYLRPEASLTADEVPELIGEADIVVDQIVVGAYGLMACQTMAAGRLSIANTRDIGFLRDICPIVDADPDTLESVIRGLLAHPETWHDIANQGRAFVREFHDGEATAKALLPFLENQT